MRSQNSRKPAMTLAGVIFAVVMMATASQAVITPNVEALLLRERWDSAFTVIADDTNNVNDPVSRMISLHCCIWLNRNRDVNVLAEATFKSSQLKAWQAWTEDFLARNPKSPVAIYLSSDAICRTAFFANKSDSAFQAAADRATEALNIDAGFLPARLARGIAYQNLRLYDKSVEDLTQVTTLRRKVAEAWFYRAISFERQEKWDSALAMYATAIEHSTNFPRAWVFRGAVFQTKNMYDSALADCDKGLEGDPTYAVAHLVKAQTYEKMERNADAIKEYTAFVNTAGEIWQPQVKRVQKQLETLKGK